MSRNIDWELRIKRKDGIAITEGHINMLSNSSEYGGCFTYENFIPANPAHTEFLSCFFTESSFAASDLREDLEAFTAANPEFLIQLNGDNDLDEHWRTNFADGESEDMEGYIEYGDPMEVFY